MKDPDRAKAFFISVLLYEGLCSEAEVWKIKSDTNTVKSVSLKLRMMSWGH